MKTAKQMFEELGWKCVGEEKSGDGIIYEITRILQLSQKVIDRIVFYRKRISCVGIWFVKKDKKSNYVFEQYTNSTLNTLELQAINKQVEELGWGKEEENEN